jgi:protein-tyrosine phosphatase
MAEGLLCDKIKVADANFEISSAGTNDYHIGEAPDKRAQENMKKNGHDISGLSARQFRHDDFITYDRIYVMDKSNYKDVVALAKNDAEKKKVDLFLNIAHPGENREVPDPYFGGEDGFQEVYEMLEQSADVLISELTEVEKG